MEKDIPCKRLQMKASVVSLNMNVRCKAKCITRDEEGHFMVIKSLIYQVIKSLIYQVETKILNFKTPVTYSKYIKHKMIETIKKQKNLESLQNILTNFSLKRKNKNSNNFKKKQTTQLIHIYTISNNCAYNFFYPIQGIFTTKDHSWFIKQVSYFKERNLIDLVLITVALS